MSQSDIKSINAVDLNQFIYIAKKIYYISLGKHSYKRNLLKIHLRPLSWTIYSLTSYPTF